MIDKILDELARKYSQAKQLEQRLEIDIMAIEYIESKVNSPSLQNLKYEYYLTNKYNKFTKSII